MQEESSSAESLCGDSDFIRHYWGSRQRDLWRKPLTGILTIAIAAAVLSTAVGVWALDLSLWGGLLLYSVSGMAATLFVAWRRVQCLDHHAAQPDRG